MDKIHPKLAEALRKHLGSKPRVAVEVREVLRDLNEVLWESSDAAETEGETAPPSDSSALLRATLDSTMDCIVVLDEAGTILAHNRRFAEVWNIPLAVIESGDFERVLPNILFALKHPETFEKRLRGAAADPATGQTEVLEFVDGRYYEFGRSSECAEAGTPNPRRRFVISELSPGLPFPRGPRFHDCGSTERVRVT